MANERESFPTLEDGTEEGAAISLRQAGDAVSSANEHGVLVAEDSGSLLQHLEQRDEGQSGSGVAGLAPFVAEDDSGNLIRLKVNSDGELVVSSELTGIRKTDQAVVTGVIGVQTDVASITLTISKDHDEPEILVSSTRTVLWELIQIDDATTTISSSWF